MKLIYFLLFALSGHFLIAQDKSDRKLVVITLDGYRWKEAFTGADSAKLFTDAAEARDSAELIQKFWNNEPAKRRKKLMPFLWSTIVKNGQIYGNRNLHSDVNVKNPYWFSYPGYNEIFTGFPDTAINSNGYPPNPNVTVLEYINKQPGYTDGVAAFASWLSFNNILNKDRCNFPVNAGYTAFEGNNITDKQKILNETQFLLPKVFGNHERPDAITYYLAKEYMIKNHPKVLYISFIETDAYAHRNKYTHYLSSAQNNDTMIKDMWEHLQNDPFYKDQTTLFIATDHGRGNNEGDNWTHHNSKEAGSDQVWFAVMGPYSKPLGEIKDQQVYQYQYARTMAALLGMDFTGPEPKGPVVNSVIK